GKAAGPLEDVGRSAEALLRQQRRGNAALRGMRSLDALSRRAGVVELRNAAWIAAGESDRFLNAPRGVTAAEQQPARGSGGAEHAAGAGALEAAFEVARLHRQADADGGFVAGHDRRHHLWPGRADILGGR